MSFSQTVRLLRVIACIYTRVGAEAISGPPRSPRVYTGENAFAPRFFCRRVVHPATNERGPVLVAALYPCRAGASPCGDERIRATGLDGTAADSACVINDEGEEKESILYLRDSCAHVYR